MRAQEGTYLAHGQRVAPYGTMVRVHQHAACIADSSNQAVGRSRGGLTSKLHVVVDGKGLPLRLGITAGQAHDNHLCSTLLVSSGGKIDETHRYEIRRGPGTHSSRPNELAVVLAPIKAKP